MDLKMLKRYKPGQPSTYDSPELLWKVFIGYVRHYQSNPLYKVEAKVADSIIQTVKLPKMRLLAVSSFCSFANISMEYFRRLGSGENMNGLFVDVVAEIQNQINNSRHEGASADLLNANYVARLNGLADNINSINFNVPVSKEEVKQISKMLEDDL